MSEVLVDSDTWYPIGIVNGHRITLNSPGKTVYQNENGPLYFAVRFGWDEE